MTRQGGVRRTVVCAVCGKEKVAQGETVPFHFGPCGHPCKGGVLSDEERTYHKFIHGENCACAVGMAPVASPTPTVLATLTVEPLHVDVVNRSTVVSDAEVEAIVAALQIQNIRDFAPLWGLPALLHFVPIGAAPDPTHWALYFLDDADQAGELGVHDLTAAGLPLGKVFAKTAQRVGCSIPGTASHELTEMLADPFINLAVQQDDVTLVAYENSDPVEDDRYGYEIDGILMSDFVTPKYFEEQDAMPNTLPFPRPAPDGTTASMAATPAAQRFDFGGYLTGPFQILPGGYLSVLKMGSTQGWTQIDGQEPEPVPGRRILSAYQRIAHVGSRRERRRRGVSRFIRSTNG